VIHHLTPTRLAGFVLANGSMSSNQSGEGEIRRNIVEADLLDCVVALPDRLFYSTQGQGVAEHGRIAVRIGDGRGIGGVRIRALPEWCRRGCVLRDQGRVVGIELAYLSIRAPGTDIRRLFFESVPEVARHAERLPRCPAPPPTG